MSDEEKESQEQGGGGDEATIRQQWMTERQQAMLEARKKVHGGGISDAAEKAKQMADRMAKLQKAWRVFNATTGLISIADLGLTLFITWLSMNGQLIFGNGFKVKYVPPLALWEILILAMVDLLVGILFLAAFTLLVVIVSCAGWTGTVQCAWVVGWDAVKALW